MLRLADLLRRPEWVVEQLVSDESLYGLVGGEVRVRNAEFVVLWLTLEPWLPMAELGYPVERVAITVRQSGATVAVPIGPSREWVHRNPYRAGSLSAIGDLCLWYPGDPDALKWSWEDGFASYVTIVHRHLMAEEFARRNEGEWPAEDAPHGSGPHPIRSIAMHRVATAAGQGGPS